VSKANDLSDLLCLITFNINPNISVRLGKVLGNGPEIWLRMQQAHDVWEAETELADELEDMPIYSVA
jgi:plasmid maintenance system antidote protein VapI